MPVETSGFDKDGDVVMIDIDEPTVSQKIQKSSICNFTNSSIFRTLKKLKSKADNLKSFGTK